MPDHHDTIADQTYDGKPVIVRRSTRRRKTISATVESGQVIVSIPATLTTQETNKWVDTMLKRLQKQQQRRTRTHHNPQNADEHLMKRSRQLVDKYLGGQIYPESVRWSTQQRRVWGNCKPGARTIRLNVALQKMPDWVVDYVLVHELAHLLEASHNKRFWDLVAAYPKTERARGYLEGVVAAEALGLNGAVPCEDDVDDDVDSD